MEDAAQAEAYAAADFEESDARFVTTFLERFGSHYDGPLADLGCGPGNIALRLARALPRCRIVGIDGSSAMLRLARDRAANLPNVSFVQAVLPSPSLRRGSFAALVSNSLLHHLHEPEAFWRALCDMARPGAAVLVGDLRRPPSPEAALALVEEYAAEAPPVLRRDFHASLHAAFEPDEIVTQLDEAGLFDWEVHPVGDRHLIVAGRVPAEGR
jgi:trans-aconitate methyltransferase